MSKKTKKKNIEGNSEEFRSFPLWMILISGIIIFLAGIYLTITNTMAEGISLPNRIGQGGGYSIRVAGPGFIIIGIGICIFPSIQLIKIYRKKID